MDPWVILFGLIAFFVAAVAYRLITAASNTSSASTAPSGILFLGPVGSGKTAAFHALFDRKNVRTQMSTKQNVATIGQTTVTDVPGRLPASDSLISRATGVVLFVDSTGFSEPSYADVVARVLAPVITDSSLLARKVPVLIAVTKRDLSWLTIPVHRVVERIERALTDLAAGAAAAAGAGSAASDARLATILNSEGQVKLDGLGLSLTVEAVTPAGDKTQVTALKDFVKAVSG